MGNVKLLGLYVNRQNDEIGKAELLAILNSKNFQFAVVKGNGGVIIKRLYGWNEYKSYVRGYCANNGIGKMSIADIARIFISRNKLVIQGRKVSVEIETVWRGASLISESLKKFAAIFCVVSVIAKNGCEFFHKRLFQPRDSDSHCG